MISSIQVLSQGPRYVQENGKFFIVIALKHNFIMLWYSFELSN